jgi:hypothetical protein
MVHIHYLSGKDGVLVITGKINKLDREKETQQKQNRWRGISEATMMSRRTSWAEVEMKATEIGARYILQTSTGSYYLKCFPSRDIHIPTSGELWDQIHDTIAPDDFQGRRSRIWILDYL